MGRTCVRSAHFAFQGVYGTMVDRLECDRRMSCVHVVFGRHLTGTAPKQAFEAVLVVCSGFGRAQRRRYAQGRCLCRRGCWTSKALCACRWFSHETGLKVLPACVFGVPCVSDTTKCACRIVPVTPFCAPFTWEPCTRPRHCLWCVGWWHRYAPSCSHTSCVCRLAWQLLFCVATSVGPACGLCAHGTWFRRPIW